MDRSTRDNASVLVNAIYKLLPQNQGGLPFLSCDHLPGQTRKMTNSGIPKFQNAAVRVGDGDDAREPLKKIEVDLPGSDQILVKINWSNSSPDVGFNR